MATLDLRYYDEVTGQWEAPLANGVDLDALEVLLGQHFNATNPHNVTKSQVGLANVDNTSDVDKPISTATQQALAGKADANSLAPIYQEIDAVEQQVTAHLAQKTSRLIITARDASLQGEQIVTGFDKKPKALIVQSYIQFTKISSLGFVTPEAQVVRAQSEGGMSLGNTKTIYIGDTDYNNFVAGEVTINDNNTITINWTKNGNGVIGTIDVFILALYHGEDAV